MSHLHFRREIVQTLFGKAPDKTIRFVPKRMPVDGTRFEGDFHACKPAPVASNAKKYYLHVQAMRSIALHKMC